MMSTQDSNAFDFSEMLNTLCSIPQACILFIEGRSCDVMQLLVVQETCVVASVEEVGDDFVS